MSTNPNPTGPASTTEPGKDATVTPPEGTQPANPDEGDEGGKQLTTEELLEANRTKNAEARNLRDRLKAAEAQVVEYTTWKESQKTDEQKNADRLQALEAENTQLKRSGLISKIQSDTGLPDKLAELLRGENETELRAHAEELAALIPKAPETPVPPVPNPGQHLAGDESVEDPRQKAAKAFLASTGFGPRQ